MAGMIRNLVCGVLLAAAAFGQAPAGRWDGIAVISGQKVPFRIDFEGKSDEFRANLVHGDARLASTSGSFDGAAVRLTFDAVRVEAKLADGQLAGTFESGGRKIPFTASAYCTCGVEGEAGPDIAGTWDIADAGQIVVRRVGDDTIVSGLGFTTLAGRFDGIAFQLHYFDGARAALAEIEPKDGGLTIVVKEPGVPEKRYRAVKASR
jgi:hypothetical protein